MAWVWVCLIVAHLAGWGNATKATSVHSRPSQQDSLLDHSGWNQLRVLASNDTEVAAMLNILLTQEYLASSFYSFAATGSGLPEDLTHGAEQQGAPQPVGARRAALSPTVQDMVAYIAADEVSHVRLLRSILGDQAVALPQLDLGPAFGAAADQAAKLWRGRPMAPQFDPYASDVDFLLSAFFLSDLEPSAYTGLAATLSAMSATEASTLVTRMMAVEGYHAGAVRSALLPRVNHRLYPRDETVGQVASWLAKLRSHWDGSSVHGAGVDTCGGSGEGPDEGPGANDCSLEGLDGLPVVAPRDRMGLIQVRTLEQTLLVLCAGKARCEGGGGFFPEGLPVPPPPAPPPSRTRRRAAVSRSWKTRA